MAMYIEMLFDSTSMPTKRREKMTPWRSRPSVLGTCQTLPPRRVLMMLSLMMREKVLTMIDAECR